MDKSWKELLIELIDNSELDKNAEIYEYLFWFCKAKIDRSSSNTAE